MTFRHLKHNYPAYIGCHNGLAQHIKLINRNTLKLIGSICCGGDLLISIRHDKHPLNRRPGYFIGRHLLQLPHHKCRQRRINIDNFKRKEFQYHALW